MSISSSGFNLTTKSVVNVITVDDDGDGDYTSISEAVNNSNPDDIIEVYSGTYNDAKINIEKEGLTIIGKSYELGNGNGAGKPLIHVQKNGIFRIYADRVSIINFFILYNKIDEYNDRAITFKDCNDCVIENNTITAESGGSKIIAIYILRGGNHKITNNSLYGILMGIDCFRTTVSIVGNKIKNINTGIDFFEVFHSVIERNRISNTKYWGIKLDASKNNLIKSNIIENGVDVGLYLTFPDSIPRTIKNIFSYNNLINNSDHIYCNYFWFGRNKYYKNYWDDWTGRGPYPIWGLNAMFLPLCYILWKFGININYPNIWTVNFDWFPAKQPYDIEV